MGTGRIRTALKIDRGKPAWEQPGLHVRQGLYGGYGRYVLTGL